MREKGKYVKGLISRKSHLAGVMVVVLCFFSVIRGRAQQVDVQAFFSRDTVLFGDQLDFTLRVVQPDTLKLQIPVFTDSITRGVEIVRPLRADTVRKKDHTLEITHRYRVIVFDTTGTVIAGPVEVSYAAHGMKATLASPPAMLVVKSLPVDPAKGPKDIKKPYNVPLIYYLYYFFFWFLVLQLLALGVYFVVVRFLTGKKHRGEMAEIARKPDEPPHVFALRELNNLKEARLWQQGRVKEYYTRLTDIFRKYLEYRYELKALEQTTGETLDSLTAAGFYDNRLYGILKEILETGDLVKFAKYQPQPDVNESVLLNAFVFVNDTKESWKKETAEGEKKGASEDDHSAGVEKALPAEELPVKEEGKEESDHA